MVALAGVSVGAAGVRAGEVDVGGPWQQNIDCGGGVVESHTVILSENPVTGLVAGGAFQQAPCGQVDVGGPRVVASCDGIVPDGLVAGDHYASPGDPAQSGRISSQFASSFDFLGCAGDTAAASLTRTVRLDGTIEVESGEAMRIVGAAAFPTLEVRDANGVACAVDGAYDQVCDLELRRNGVDASDTPQTVEPIRGVAVTFDAVVSAGTVSVTQGRTTAADLPPDFRPIGDPVVYDVATTAAVTGDVVVCVAYADADDDGVVDGSTPPICDEPSVCPDMLKILHREGGSYVNRTEAIDPVRHVICARMRDGLGPVVLGAGPVCGDGLVEGREACDAGPGNGAAWQCGCSSTCAMVAEGTPCPDDGNLCTNDTCDGAGTCRHAAEPEPSCKRVVTSAMSTLLVQDDPTNVHDTVRWKWGKGDATTIAELGNPVATTDYALCVYADAAGTSTLAAALHLPAGATCSTGPCWRAASRGFTYRDPGGAHSGVASATFAAGATGLPLLSIKAKGPQVGALGLPMVAPVRVELRNSVGTCWAADYPTPTRNTATAFRAKGNWLSASLGDRDQDGVVRIVCLGDSNTLPNGAPALPPAYQGWCTQAAALLPEVRVPGPTGDPVTLPTTFFSTGQGTAAAIDTNNALVADGPEQVAIALAQHSPDVLILAFGSVDLLLDKTPAETKDALLALEAQASGRRVYVALVPPLYEPICGAGLAVCEGCDSDVGRYCNDIDPLGFNEKVRELNRLLWASFPPGRIIDYYSIVTSQPLGTPGDFGDAVHFTNSGQAKRARKAVSVLRLGY